MPNTWEQALRAYRYPVNLSRFADASSYPEWFHRVLDTGDRDETMAFEAYFRQNAADKLEPWYEVVFWKLYNQPLGMNNITRQVIEHFRAQATSPHTLWESCSEYVKHPSRASFDSFRRLFGFATPAIAVVAAFPAFMAPDDYPMADLRTARWVQNHHETHNAADPRGPQLVPPHHPGPHGGVLTMADFDFVEAWTRWCKHTAHKLSARTKFLWRARDVEMAVFRAWGSNHQPHPDIHLTPLPAVEN